MPGGKKAKQLRKEGKDRRTKARQRAEDRSLVLHETAVKEAQKAGVEGEKLDIQVIIDGMSDAERLTMKGAATPSTFIFQRLMEKGLCKLVKDGNDIQQLIPSQLGFIVADVLHGRLVVKEKIMVVADLPPELKK